GLLPKPRKTSRNMAFYDETHVERLLTVKRLQNERFLPLAVIKRLLEGGLGPRESDLDVIAHLARSSPAGVEGPGDPGELGRGAVRRRTGFRPVELARAAAAGLVAPGRRRGRAWYSAHDVRVLDLLAQAVREAGYDFGLAVESFALYARHLAALEREE